MNRIVLSIEAAEGGHILRLVRGAAGLDPVRLPLFALDRTATWAQDFSNPGMNRAGLVGEAGDALDHCLRNLEHYKAVIAAALTASPGDPAKPIFVHMNDEVVEDLPWEALRAGNPPTFLGLDSRWPVGRMTGMEGGDTTIRAALESQLRVLVVLAAKGVSGRSQLEELRAAFDPARAHLDWRITVLTKDDDDLTAVAEWARDGAPVVAERFDSRQQLFDVLVRDKPHLAHFFCHGTAGGGTSQAGPTLLFATALDELIDRPESVPVVIGDLIAQPALLDSLWLLVLNCCESALPRGLPSLARSLVQKHLVPAVVGMREKVPPTNAHVFCRPFYREILQIIAAVQDGSLSEVEWVGALVGTRRELVNTLRVDPADLREWTVPVIYVRPEAFVLQPVPNDEELLEELDYLIKFRASLGATAPPSKLARIDARIRELKALLLS
ncbi:CHAT domain-containing protein [Paludisphaera rhizosphaerae]|uniref:CHAT domain-containing protein n=1 Tax=Paludisphaera rhizosphaerae TaxID=2711216 RepID=UPI0013ECC99C|nr:CHAT domain-containing protein [Paludisphaera rhizosphaerae]